MITSLTNLAHVMYPLWGIFIYSEKKHNDILNADKRVILGVQVCKPGYGGSVIF